MYRERTPFGTRLTVEKLETRTLLSANGLPGGGSQEGGGLPGTLPASLIASAVVANFGTNGNALNAIPNANSNVTVANTSGPSATTGVGQMTITTGANTLGIGSSATPTCGTAARGAAGGIVN